MAWTPSVKRRCFSTFFFNPFFSLFSTSLVPPFFSVEYICLRFSLLSRLKDGYALPPPFLNCQYFSTNFGGEDFFTPLHFVRLRGRIGSPPGFIFCSPAQGLVSYSPKFARNSRIFFLFLCLFVAFACAIAVALIPFLLLFFA